MPSLAVYGFVTAELVLLIQDEFHLTGRHLNPKFKYLRAPNYL